MSKDLLDRAKTLLDDFRIHDPSSAEMTLRSALLLVIDHLETEMALDYIEFKERVG